MAKHHEQLLTLSGILWGLPNGSRPLVQSSIYWGAHDSLQELKNTIVATMEIGPDSAEEVVDSHSLMTLFALAIDAHARDCDSATVRHLFQGALNRANNLERAGRLKGDLIQVKEAIETFLSH